MLFCDACDKGYHMDCHTPEVQAKPSGSWICCRCEQEIIGKKKRNSARLSPTITNNNHHSATKPVQNGTIVKSEVIENGVGAGGEGESSVQPLNNGTKVESQQHPSGCSPWVKSHLLKQLLDRKPDYEMYAELNLRKFLYSG